MVVFVVPCSLAARQAPAAAQHRVEALALEEVDGGVDLSIAVTAIPAWTTQVRSDGWLELVLEETLIDAQVSDLSSETGIVAQVRIRQRGVRRSRRSVIEIGIRVPTAYSVQATDDGLTVRIRRTEAPPVAPPPPAEAIVDSADESVSLARDTELVDLLEEEPMPPAPEAPVVAVGATREPAIAAPVSSRSLEASVATADPLAPAVEPIPGTISDPAAFPPPIASEYRVGAGDVLSVAVFDLPDLDRRVRVSPTGSISLPLVGNIPVAGLTLHEAERALSLVLAERRLVNDPQVTIFVDEYLSRGVAVQGAVHAPGVYQMIEQKSLLEVLSDAGGLLARDGERAGQRIFVLRQTAAGGQVRLEIDTERLIHFGDPRLNVALAPGDVVVVPPAQTLRVYVSGAVQNPGAVDYVSSEGITLLQAITAAGGATERTNLRKVFVIRLREDGSRERIPVNVKKIRKGQAEDLLLQRNDTVLVGEWFL